MRRCRTCRRTKPEPEFKVRRNGQRSRRCKACDANPPAVAAPPSDPLAEPFRGWLRAC